VAKVQRRQLTQKKPGFLRTPHSIYEYSEQVMRCGWNQQDLAAKPRMKAKKTGILWPFLAFPELCTSSYVVWQSGAP
jgi:hypothetical protein